MSQFQQPQPNTVIPNQETEVSMDSSLKAPGSTGIDQIKEQLTMAMVAGLDKDPMIAVEQLESLAIIFGKAIKAIAQDLGCTTLSTDIVTLRGVNLKFRNVETIPNHTITIDENISLLVRDLSTIHSNSDYNANEPHKGSIDVKIQEIDDLSSIDGFRIAFTRGGIDIQLLQKENLARWNLDSNDYDTNNRYYTFILDLAIKYLALGGDQYRNAFPNTAIKP